MCRVLKYFVYQVQVIWGGLLHIGKVSILNFRCLFKVEWTLCAVNQRQKKFKPKIYHGRGLPDGKYSTFCSHLPLSETLVFIYLSVCCYYKMDDPTVQQIDIQADE